MFFPARPGAKGIPDLGRWGTPRPHEDGIEPHEDVDSRNDGPKHDPHAAGHQAQESQGKRRFAPDSRDDREGAGDVAQQPDRRHVLGGHMVDVLAESLGHAQRYENDRDQECQLSVFGSWSAVRFIKVRLQLCKEHYPRQDQDMVVPPKPSLRPELAAETHGEKEAGETGQCPRCCEDIWTTVIGVHSEEVTQGWVRVHQVD